MLHSVVKTQSYTYGIHSALLGVQNWKPPTESLCCIYFAILACEEPRGYPSTEPFEVKPAAALWGLKGDTAWSRVHSSSGSFPYLLAFLSSHYLSAPFLAQVWGAVSRQPQLQPERKKSLRDKFPPASNTLIFFPFLVPSPTHLELNTSPLFYLILETRKCHELHVNMTSVN